MENTANSPESPSSAACCPVVVDQPTKEVFCVEIPMGNPETWFHGFRDTQEQAEELVVKYPGSRISPNKWLQYV